MTAPGAPPRSRLHRLVEWLVVVVVAVGVAALVESFAIQAFSIPTGSMEPAIDPWDRVLVNKLSYAVHPVHRGDIVVFHRVPADVTTSIHDLIKRVIGLPGETLRSGADGEVLVDGRPIAQPWLTAASRADPGPAICNPGSEFSQTDCSGPLLRFPCAAGQDPGSCAGRVLHLPAGEYYVMGDNRGDSDDSRYWGPVPRSAIIGRAFLRFWPLSRIRWF